LTNQTEETLYYDLLSITSPFSGDFCRYSVMQIQSILLISSNSSSRGGGERYLVYLARGMRDIGIKVYVLLSTLQYMNYWEAELAEVGAEVYRFPLKSLSQRKLRFLSAMFDRRQVDTISFFCKALNPDAILVNQQYDEDGIDYLEGALTLTGVPVMGVMHMPMTLTKNQRPLGRLRGLILSYWYARHPYRLTFVSEGAKAEFEEYYTLPYTTYVVNNSAPFNMSISDELPTLFFPEDHLPIIGFVGQFVPQKNLKCLIESWYLLVKRGILTRLLLVGDGPERLNLEKRLKILGNSDAWSITGWTSKPELMLSCIDVFVMCSHFEGLPLSLVEAAGRGITCVVTPFNGASDVAKHAPWVHVTRGHSDADLVETLEQVLLSECFRLPVLPEKLAVFRAHFSIHRMAMEVVNVMEIPACIS